MSLQTITGRIQMSYLLLLTANYLLIIENFVIKEILNCI